jgi:hypothetical protein
MHDAAAPVGVDTEKPSPARLYDYYLGGTHNFPVDREAGEKIRSALPELEDAAWVNRGFLGRAARWLAAEQGVRQFIDIGAGLPTQNNTHEAVHKVAPEARVLYVDNDPEVEAYARPLLRDVPTCTAITGDLRDPEGVLGHPETRRLIDFTEPVALLMVAVLHFIADDSDPWGIVARYRDALAPGSFLAISHGTADNQPPRPVQAIRDVYASAKEHVYFRTKSDVIRLFADWEIAPPYPGAEPAVTWIGYWGAEDPDAADSDGSRWSYAGVARKPAPDNGGGI